MMKKAAAAALKYAGGKMAKNAATKGKKGVERLKAAGRKIAGRKPAKKAQEPLENPGYQEGGAQVSEKHCGFVINRDHATASDIAGLCGTVQKRVYEQFGVKLETEVKMLGF